MEILPSPQADAPDSGGSFWRRAARRALLAGAVVATVVHLQQVIVFSGGARLPGDLGDGRFNNLVLEHLWRALCGQATLVSPPMFHPVAGVLFFSDTHLGTFPFYAIWRVLGLSMESAMQGWALTLSALNAASVLFWLRRRGVGVGRAALLTFFACSNFVVVGKLVHAQILPVFPAVWAVGCLGELLETGRPRWLALALGAVAYQHYCAPYLGFFLSGTLLLWAAAMLLTATGGTGRLAEICALLRARRTWGMVALSGLALAPLYAGYAWAALRQGTRGTAELHSLTPTPASWLTAAGGSVWYSRWQFLPPAASGVEHSLFAGLGFWLALLLLGCAGWKHRNEPLGAGALALAAAMGALVAAVTRWPGMPESVFWAVEYVITPFRAFRSVGRMVFLFVPLTVIGLGFLWSALMRERGWLRRVAGLLPVLLAVESLSGPSYSYAKAEAQDRARAVAEAFGDQGARPVLAFAPGPVSQPAWVSDLDGVAGIWALGRQALNGYSGSTPKSHRQFFETLTPEAANAIMAKFHLPADSLGVATAYPRWFEEKYGLLRYPLATPCIRLEPSGTLELSGRAGQPLSAEVRLINQLSMDLPCRSLNLHLSYRLFGEDSREISDSPSPRTVIELLPKNGTLTVTMPLVLPSRPGRYEARVSMVREGVGWWDDMGAHGFRISLRVE